MRERRGQVNQYGNITKTVPSGGTGIIWNPGYTAANNHYQLSGTSYDTNGNILNDSFATYTWNVYGRAATLADSSHNYTLTYDAFDRIIEKFDSLSGNRNQYLYSPIGYIGGMSGQTLGSLLISLPGGAKYNLAGNLLHHDFLRNIRLVSNRTNQTPTGGQMYAPFGEMYATSGSTFEAFAGTQTFLTWNNGSLADAENREFRVRQGRWISPDPAGLSAVNMMNPQTWNRYAYVANTPLNAIDPSGLLANYCLGGDCEPQEMVPPSLGDMSCSTDFDCASASAIGSVPGFCPAEFANCSLYYGGGLGSTWAVPRAGILPGENSTNFPGPGLLGTIEDLLGIQLPDNNCEFGMVCDSGIPALGFGSGEPGLPHVPSLVRCLDSALEAEQQALNLFDQGFENRVASSAMYGYLKGAATAAVLRKVSVLGITLASGMSAAEAGSIGGAVGFAGGLAEALAFEPAKRWYVGANSYLGTALNCMATANAPSQAR